MEEEEARKMEALADLVNAAESLEEEEEMVRSIDLSI